MSSESYGTYFSSLQNDLIHILSKLFSTPITNENPLISAYLIGSTVDRLLSGTKDIGRDIDILLIFTELYHIGTIPVDEVMLRQLATQWNVIGYPVAIIFNGVLPPSIPDKHVVLDFTWDCMPRIENRWAHSVVTAHKPKYLLKGPNVYAPLENIPLSLDILTSYIKITDQYLRREYIQRSDAAACYAIAKASIFVLGLVVPDAVNTNVKRRILDILKAKYPELTPILDTLDTIRQSPHSHQIKDVWALYNIAKDAALGVLAGCMHE